MKPEERKNLLLLNLKKHLEPTMRKKLDPATPWNYLDALDSDKSSELLAMTHFIDNLLDQFIERCINTLSNFSQKDCDSLGSINQTQTATDFINLFFFLEENGFSFRDQLQKPLIFWSGKIARLKAAQDTRGISDNQVPSISVMVDVCKCIQEIQGNYDDYILMLSSAISRVFAMHAQDIATVYINSEKHSEKAGFTSPNVFWQTELPTLMLLHHQGRLRDIRVHHYDHQKNEWGKAISIFSREGDNIQIYRRSFHHMHDNPKHQERFKKSNATEIETKQWIASQPRPSITYGRLKEMAKIWRDRNKRKVATPSAISTSMILS